MAKPNKPPDKDWMNQPDEFRFDLSAENIDSEQRTVELSITEETAVPRWFGMLVLGHNPGECRLDRIGNVASFLFAHGRDPNFGVVPIGQILSVWLDEAARKYRAQVKFDTDEKSELLWQKVQSGSLRGISVGVEFKKFLEVPAGESERGFAGPVTIVTDWEITEISLEPTPAMKVGVGLSLAESEESVSGLALAGGVGPEIQAEEQEGKFVEEIKQPGLAPVQANTPPAEELSAQAVAAERKRCTEIAAICNRFSIDGAEQQTFIDQGLSVADVNQKVIDKLAAERKAIPSIQVVKDESEKFAAAAADGLALRAGVKIEKPEQGANDFRGMRLIELARECAERKSGTSLRRASDEEVIKAAFGFGQFMGASDFPNILANVANKSMSTAYEAANTTYQLWTRKSSLPDFKAASRLTLSHAADLEEIKADGEFVVGEFTEGKQSIQIKTYGKRWGLNRQAIINDDLDAFSVLPMRFAIAARRKVNAAVYSILNTNATFGTAALFHADHKNLAASGAVVSVETLAAARAAMRKQKDIGSKQTLNIEPVYALFPVSKATLAEQVIGSSVDPAKSNATPNPFFNRLTVVSDPELDGSDGTATAWYLAGAPGITDTIEVAFLNGRDQPTIESQVSFDILGINWRIYLDFGVQVLDYRAMYKNGGA